MVTGYWPPTNEMVRHFSQNINLNPDGWQGENWEGTDMMSYLFSQSLILLIVIIVELDMEI